jgi:uncharacterized membrane protein HdeD (DUF308 family)
MNISAIVIGAILFLGGLAILIYIKPVSISSVILGVVLIAAGIFMILNSEREDKIEKIKTK